MYRYTEFDRQFVHQRAAQFRDQLRAPPRRRASRRRLPGAAPAERLVRPAPCADAARGRALWRAELEAAARPRPHRPRVRRPANGGPYEDRAGGFGHFTTRQNCQFNWIALADAADVMDILADVDMHGIQTSGNCIRNITSDCFAGVAADEIVDPRPYCEILRQWSTLHPEFAFLPRKFKIAVSGTLEDRAATAWHDIGLVLKKNEAGEIGFEVRVGGGMGRTPIIGTVIRDFLPWKRDPGLHRGDRPRLQPLRPARQHATRRGSRSWSRPRGRSSSTRSRPSSRTSASTTSTAAPHLLTDAELDRVSACFELRARRRDAVDRRAPSISSPTPPPAARAYRRWLRAQRPSAPHPRLPRGDALAQARRPAAGRRHRRPDGRRRRPWPTASASASCGSRTTRTWCCRGCSEGELAALWEAARAERLRHAQHRLPHRHDRLPRRRPVRARQRPLAADRRGDQRALRRPRRAARHRRHRPAHQRLHQFLRPPPQRPHRHPRRRQGRQGVVPGLARRHRTARPSAAARRRAR